jgi:hypothetical protein
LAAGWVQQHEALLLLMLQMHAQTETLLLVLLQTAHCAHIMCLKQVQGLHAFGVAHQTVRNQHQHLSAAPWL